MELERAPVTHAEDPRKGARMPAHPSRGARSSTGLLSPRARAASLLGCSMIACTRCWLAAFSTGTFRLHTST
jgi:hypothetical protein